MNVYVVYNDHGIDGIFKTENNARNFCLAKKVDQMKNQMCDLHWDIIEEYNLHAYEEGFMDTKVDTIIEYVNRTIVFVNDISHELSSREEICSELESVFPSLCYIYRVKTMELND